MRGVRLRLHADGCREDLIGPFTIAAAAVLTAGIGYAGHESLSTCAIGLTATEATITVSGWRANAGCHTLIGKDTAWVYLRGEPPTGEVICEVRHMNRRYTVRDRDVLMVVGRTACISLNDPAT